MTLRPALSRGGLLLATLLLVSACKPANQAPTDVAPPAAQAPAAAQPAAPVVAEPEAPKAPRPAQARPLAGPPPVAGTDYVEIAGGAPFDAAAGGIEVVEVFGYTCPACAAFEPLLQDWKQQQPEDVRVVPVAAPFGGYWMPYAKAYYAAQAQGLAERTHQAMFNAIHVESRLPVQPTPSNEQIAQFYAAYGANAQQFASTMDSFAVNAKLKRAEQWIARAGVPGTPTIIVAGKYRVTGKTQEDTLRIAEHLVARERGAAPAAAPAAAANG